MVNRLRPPPAELTDPVLATTVDALTMTMTAHIVFDGAQLRLPRTTGHPDYDTWLLCAITSIQGFTMRVFTPRLRRAASWTTLRRNAAGVTVRRSRRLSPAED